MWAPVCVGLGCAGPDFRCARMPAQARGQSARTMRRGRGRAVPHNRSAVAAGSLDLRALRHDRAPPTRSMNESDLRHVLLLQAVETDEAGRALAWTPADAAWASAAARREVGEQAGAQAFLVRRAQLGLRRLVERDAQWRRVVELPTGHGGAWAALLLAAAYLVGIAGDAFTALHRVDLLPQTLLTVLLLAWNAAVYAVLLVAALRRSGPGRGRRHWFEGVADRLWAPVWRQLGGHALAGWAAVQAHFVVLWSAATRALQQRRALSLLHAGAALLTLGVVSSMYLRGLVFDYRAGWDSTFLDAAQVHALLGAVLGPASALSGIGLPDVPALARLRWAEGGGEGAARWIHLYALTLVGAVVVPRLLLAVWAAMRARQAAQRLVLPLEDPYFVRLQYAAQAAPRPVTVLPYSYQLGATQQAGLTAALVDALGPGVQPRLVETLPLGAEDALPQGLPADLADTVVALFALTATPEREAHGAFLQALARRVAGSDRLHVLVDESGFRQRFDAMPDRAVRLAQRREAWQRLLQEMALPAPRFVDLAASAQAPA
jgi:Protein of unknown function (DUF2868)